MQLNAALARAAWSLAVHINHPANLRPLKYSFSLVASLVYTKYILDRLEQKYGFHRYQSVLL